MAIRAQTKGPTCGPVAAKVVTIFLWIVTGERQAYIPSNDNPPVRKTHATALAADLNMDKGK